MSQQVNIFLLLFGGLQGLLLVLFLFKKKLYRSGYVFLLAYLGVLLLQITLKVMSKFWLMQNWPLLYSYSYYLPLLYGPLAFLYVKYLLRPSPFNKWEALHFAPFLFISMMLLLENLNSYQFGVYNYLLPVYTVRYYLLLVSLVIYHGLAFNCWRTQRNSKHAAYPHSTIIQSSWLRQFIIVSFFAGVLVSTALYLLYKHYPFGHEYRYGFVVLTVFIYWCSYVALTNPVVFSTIKGEAVEEPSRQPAISPLKVYHPPVKYSNSGLSDERLQYIITSLEELMVKERLFLQPSLTIVDLADRLHCKRHHLSQALNDQLGKSYYDYINQWRVEEAILLLNSPSGDQQKVASIAYESGFNSLSTFNDVFKKSTGKTPSDFRKEKLKELQKQRV